MATLSSSKTVKESNVGELKTGWRSPTTTILGQQSKGQGPGPTHDMTVYECSDGSKSHTGGVTTQGKRPTTRVWLWGKAHKSIRQSCV